eukprot:2722340-Lingulodinium_polyedra.AAC.1
MVHIRWADKHLHEGEEAELYWRRVLSADGKGTDAASAAGSTGGGNGAASKYEMREPSPGEVAANWVAPWVIARTKGNQEWWNAYCIACWAFVTDGHIDSTKHISK